MEIQQHDGVVVEVAGFQQGFAKRCVRWEMCHGREREAPGALAKVGDLGWFLALQVHWGVGKGGGKKSHQFPSPPIGIPLFRDLDLIPSGYDLIPSKVGSWCALTRGVGPCTYYPRSCGPPHAGGPHFGTF